jgi:hypothetical protein
MCRELSATYALSFMYVEMVVYLKKINSHPITKINIMKIKLTKILLKLLSC